MPHWKVEAFDMVNLVSSAASRCCVSMSHESTGVFFPRAAFQWQAMSELWEEDEALRKALPWNALTLRAPQNEMRQT